MPTFLVARAVPDATERTDPPMTGWGVIAPGLSK